mmetsp:Transcript_100/g.279  ORF Transcript_100/g.279 Transcript_100/m.279 type:complete len:252 (-) Transcript_100:573-1328(-)
MTALLPPSLQLTQNPRSPKSPKKRKPHHLHHLTMGLLQLLRRRASGPGRLRRQGGRKKQRGLKKLGDRRRMREGRKMQGGRKRQGRRKRRGKELRKKEERRRSFARKERRKSWLHRGRQLLLLLSRRKAHRQRRLPRCNKHKLRQKRLMLVWVAQIAIAQWTPLSKVTTTLVQAWCVQNRTDRGPLVENPLRLRPKSRLWLMSQLWAQVPLRRSLQKEHVMTTRRTTLKRRSKKWHSLHSTWMMVQTTESL